VKNSIWSEVENFNQNNKIIKYKIIKDNKRIFDEKYKKDTEYKISL
jgi:hypothetical protein